MIPEKWETIEVSFVIAQGRKCFWAAAPGASDSGRAPQAPCDRETEPEGVQGPEMPRLYRVGYWKGENNMGRKLQGCFSYTPQPGLNLQPRHVPLTRNPSNPTS